MKSPQVYFRIVAFLREKDTNTVSKSNMSAEPSPSGAVQPYLFFNGDCETAIEFYRAQLGAKVVLMMRFSDSPEPLPPGMVPEGYENKIMHATLEIGGSTVMASDGPTGDKAGFSGFSLSFSAKDETEADRIFAALSEGGEVGMPMSPTFWSPKFGTVFDRFGVSWMVSVATPEYS